ncbi:Threonyl alanyl tRNA synthetase SAD [Fusarium pseudocircinatum]|uniref:Threonyl alanyl tRNA synthetase SAD n=1 Tax=Fusarium pseudocircinatum TaxID=56676 RepID=A0A8H5UYI7_9HYPO|nr:Threonyl alanyl tRNA synthetase SAD [Fusarium pseudocircinatum]
MGKVLALMDSIKAGKSPASALGFVDLEYNIFTGRVFEIGMCDTYGTKTMDCRTLYGSEALRAISQTSSTADLNMDRMIMSSVKAHYCTQGSRTAKQVADELKRQGISQEAYFIAWHFHTDDLSRLREWLESEGEYGVLPPNSQCIPLIPYFQRNLQGAKLSNNKRFPLTLPILFPIMMGTDHVLAGRNHHALVDAQQQQFMMAIFRVLCLSPQNRPDGWLEQFSQDPSSHRPGLRQAFLESFWEGS